MTLLELQKEFKEKLTEFDKDLSDSRLLSRDVIYKIIILCSTIIAFSVTLISLSQLDLKIDVGKLKTSWYLFLATIILGFSALFLEGRLHYALKWRAFQVQDYDKDYKHPLKDKLKVFIICIRIECLMGVFFIKLSLNLLSKTILTEALLVFPSSGEPFQIRSSPLRPRIDFIDCSPRAKRKASAMFDLPLPLGPTIAETGWSN